MRRRFALASAVALAAAFAPAAAAQTFDWTTATPESQGMSSSKLVAMKDALAARSTTHFLVIRNDKVVYEWYVSGHSRTTKHYTASLAKALVGGVSLGVAMDDGLIGLDDLATKYVPQWTGVSRKKDCKVRHLGSHTAGMEDAQPKDEPGWKSDFWKRLAPPNDPFTISRDKTPFIAAPGTSEIYSNPGIAMLTYCVTASLKNAPVKEVRTLLRDRIMRPIGVPDAEWSCGYGQTFTVDGLPLVPSWGGGNYTPNAAARVGRLMLKGGTWQGTELLNAAAVQAITTDAGTPGNGAQGWWTNSDGSGGTLPASAYWGAGAGHQVTLVVPSLSIIAVRFGETLDSSLSYDAALRKHFFDPLMGAVTTSSTSGAPYPASTAITGITWAPASSIVRKAKGCDTWPLTWADDGNLYAAYGDGNGFEPQLSTKLSLGFAKISGSASSFTGTNIRSASGEQTGDGAKGKKASGMLMVDGVLYMWVRNADNNGNQSQLAWSTDRAATWTWSTWKFAEFGYPTFINFGQNYAGARDTYVYAVSHDNPNAYTEADRFILMRVPKGEIKTRSSWQFFKGRDTSGNPVWTSDITQRGAVFTHAGRCRRSGISYNAGLKRYLWWQMYHEDGVDNRFSGGFGVYDAPEPWGPWTTVYFTKTWDVGPGETGSFPPKWMSADGKTVHLVFSGDDHFSVRQATLTASTSGGNAPPSVTITSPTAGATYTAPASIAIQASASDSDGSVTKVEFFANGTLLGSDTTSPYSFSWSGVAAGSYSLTARAFDNAGASTTSSPVSITVNAPSNAPPTVSITSPASGASFTAPATIAIQASASDSDGSVTKVEFFQGTAKLGEDTTSPYGFTWSGVPAGSYSLTARATDNGGASTTSAAVTVTVSAGGSVVSNTSPSTYAWDVLDVGKVQYVDRTYTFSSVPAAYVGLLYLRTKNDDKNSTGTSWISFDVSQDVTVYVAHDDRITTKPSWMSGFSDTGHNLVSGGGTFSLFAKNFPAGRVTLGGNIASGTTGYSMYTVVVRPLSGGTAFSVTVDSVSTGKTYSLSTAQAGALYYTDRSYTIGSLASTLSGAKMIRTANDDKYVTASVHLKFTVNQTAAVYVAYDKRATKNPSWLNDGTWTLTTLPLSVSDSGASPMRVFSKSVPAGQVTLGGNHAGGNTGALSNYFVIVKGGSTSAARQLAEDVWEHAGDADGDGLMDDFEVANFLDPANSDSDGDGEPDETELAPSGKPYWEEQGAGSAPEGGGDSGGGGCGATGAEGLLFLALLGLISRRAR